MSGTVVAVNVGGARRVGRRSATAIDKRPVAGPVPVGPLGPAGDEHVYAGHGGPYQALYAYAGEDAEFWEAELGRELWPGAFGENLTTRGVDISGGLHGERWLVGSVLLEVTHPRIPCATFAGFWDVPDLVRRFAAAGRPGAYLRVVEEGVLAAGDPVDVVSRPRRGVTVAELSRARMGDRSLLSRVRELTGLAPSWRDWVDSTADVKPSG